MNLPHGAPVKRAVDISVINFGALIKELKKKVFNGYLCEMVMGVGGIEEGVLLFDNGKIVAAWYDYLKYGKTIEGEGAIKRILNASAAKSGVLDIYQLTNDQVQLILAFNEKAIVVPDENSIINSKIEKFSEFYENQIKEMIKSSEKESETEVLKKYKLGDIKKSGKEKLPETKESKMKLPEKVSK